MNEQLLPKATFDQLNNEASKTIQRMKDTNDELQQMNEDDYKELKSTLKEMRERFAEYAQQMQAILIQMDKKAIGQEQRRKTKNAKESCSKEISRNKTIQSELINQGYQNRRQTLKQSIANNDYKYSQDIDQQQQQQESIHLEQVEVENMLIKEQQNDLNEIESQATNLQNVVNELALHVDKADVQLEIISENQGNVLGNLKDAGNELTGAQIEQKRSQRKLIIIAVIAFLMATALGLILYFTLR